ncbi:hypothetical protein P3X46_006150 [Hevea brasiliensis]|uniref:SHSP domain-containing protein n=1 Tax=Hevea brasiliensis TaxID=3981 RepID=A0ABQ9MTE2_HEVBR|nr:uncharacterized protein LOC110667124 [Hevea brasiliensis]KAJ9182124.1 hypothetical protein P3X46_006150 [Hevea brasiliensis]
MIIISTFLFIKQNPFKGFDSHQQSNLPIFYLQGIFILLLLIAAQSRSISCSLTNYQRCDQNQETMKVHPMPKKRNNITIQYYINNTNGNNISHQRDPSSGGSHKKLRRLPHIFSRVLELPFRSDADVSVEENPDCFRFVAETDNIGDVRAHTIEIHPGVTKIVVRPNGYLELSLLDDLELDMWRFRLPESTRPELASAVLEDGELIVTVPKVDELEEEGNDNNGEFRGGMGNNNSARLVLVQ